jgi:3-hydroxyacyl-CoA dehydrogenase
VQRAVRGGKLDAGAAARSSSASVAAELGELEPAQLVVEAITEDEQARARSSARSTSASTAT